jgi:general secretion pathway protein G
MLSTNMPKNFSSYKTNCYNSSQRGFTLLELFIVITLISLVMMIAIPNYSDYLDRAKIATAAADISTISNNIEMYYTEHQHHPDSLSAVGMGGLLDPWKHPYVYTKIEGKIGVGGLRKDKNLVPINTDFDLYSSGKDGVSVDSLMAGVSQDDIVRANNGLFIGIAADY